MSELVGRWKLVAWRNLMDDGTIIEPLGEQPSGILIYIADGSMAVQITAADRPSLETADPVGGSDEERAGAYATCLAYCGRYEVRDDTIVHTIEISLFPNWVGAEQVRYFELSPGELVLRTPPIQAGERTVTGELRWAREDRSRD